MVLAKRHGLNQKTVAKWKPRTAVKDLPTGSKDAHSTVLSIEEEAIIVAFRKHTLLPLDDCILRPSGDDPPPDPLIPASLPATARDQSAARGDRA